MVAQPTNPAIPQSFNAIVQTSLHGLRQILAEQIPLARQLGITAVGVEEGALILAAPLATNRNYEGTAFGGSLNAIATLAGWSAVWLALQEARLDGSIVIQDSAVRYQRPVTGDFRASAALVADRRARFLDALVRKNKGRITVDVTVGDAAGPAVVFAGRYVVQR
jgi:thioesterase domain-containing protein